MIKAVLISEKSAGMTVVQVYNNDKLVWSHDYFRDGATDSQYNNGMRQVYDDMVACNDYSQFEGNDGADYLAMSAAYEALTYDGQWSDSGFDPDDGQAADFVRLNSDRLPEEIVSLVN